MCRRLHYGLLTLAFYSVFLLRLPFLTEDGLFDLILKSKPSGSKAPTKQGEKGKSPEKVAKVQTKSSPVKVVKKGMHAYF